MKTDVKLMILKNQKAYSLAKNWGMKSDILRYEILQKFGGVYIDTDYECLQNIGLCLSMLYTILHFLSYPISLCICYTDLMLILF
jgi:mannosyltransferase OCH1-like enzyme